MEKEIKITGCYHSCSFFGNSMDGMRCNHPYWKDKGAYENMIITQDNSRDGKIPEKCPLKNEQLTIVYKLDASLIGGNVMQLTEVGDYETENLI